VLRRLPPILAVVVVLAAYGFFASGGRFDFRRVKWNASNYTSLAEAFFHGHLYLPQKPDPRLTALPNPYDIKARGGEIFYMWDASYLNGHYYLYFSPLPVLLFYMPYRLLRGGYPYDPFVAAVFASWAFLAATAFARRALAGRRLHVPFTIWVLLIGLANVAPFNLTDIRIYEVAILAGTAMSAMWAHALLRFLERPSPGRAAWMALWLALAIFARPNLLVLLIPSALAMVRRTNRRLLAAALAPLAVVAAGMLWYNRARFDDPFELGVRYQLTTTSMAERTVCGVHSLPELARLANSALLYTFLPPKVQSEFPFIKLQPATFDPAVSFPADHGEEAAGVLALVPLTIAGTLFALLFVLRRQPLDAPLRAATLVMLGAWLVLFGLATCWWVVARYDLDFMLLMTAATAVTVEAGLDFLRDVAVRIQPLRIAAVVLALASIIAGFMLGFHGREDAFKRLHPALFKKISEGIS
jgi:hypothetical protein